MGEGPGEGMPENAGGRPEQPQPADAPVGAVDQRTPGASGGYAFGESVDSAAEEDDLLFMPGAQGAWSDQQPSRPAPRYQPSAYEAAAYAAVAEMSGTSGGQLPEEQSAPAPLAFDTQQGGSHESGGRDTGSVEFDQVRTQPPAAAPQPAPVTPPRRPLHMGPPLPDQTGGVVRSLADRGPAGATPPMATPIRHTGPQTTGPEYLDVPREDTPAATGFDEPGNSLPGPQLGEIPPQQSAWTAQPQPPADAGPLPEPQPPAVEETAERPEEAAAESPAEPVPEAEPADAAVPTDALTAEASVTETPDAEAVAEVLPEAAVEAPAAEPPAAEAAAADVAAPASEAPAAEAPEAAPEPAAELPEEPAAEAVPETTPDVADVAEASDASSEPMPATEPAAPAETVTEPSEAEAPAVDEAPETVDVATAPETPEPAESAEPEVRAAEIAQAAQEEPVIATASDAADEAAPVEPNTEPTLVEIPEAAETPQPEEASQPAAELTDASQAPEQQEPDEESAAEPTAPAAATVEAVQPEPESEQAEQAEQSGRTEQPEAVKAPEAAAAAAPASVPDAEPESVPAQETETAPESEAAADSDTTPETETEGAPEAEAAPATESIPDPEPEAEPETPLPLAAAADDDNAPASDPEQTDPEPTDPSADAPVEELTVPIDSVEPNGVSRDEPARAERAAAGYDDAERAAVHRVIRERRDIRNGFRPDPIPNDVLLRVLEAAHTAPSVGHSQPWDFVVIRSAETRAKMHELATQQREAYAKSLPKARAKQFRELKIEAILETPINIVVTADSTRGGRHTLGRHTQPQMAPYSSALAVENLWLAARAEGLGVGWVSFFDEREMVSELGLPDHLEVVAYLCVGYVDEFPEEPELLQAGWSKRRPLSWVVHEETYGRRALPGEDPHDLLAETLQGIRPLDAKALGEAWDRQKRMTKPAGALGILEIIAAQLSGLSRQCPPPIPEPAAVAIFAGDHGVHAQGVTPWPQEVTAQMVANFLGGGAVCNAFANQVGAEVCVIDVGVAGELPSTPGLLPRKVRHGTADLSVGPAMSREEVLRAIEVGIETARDLVAAGNKALITGEMGIANTTVSAALICVYTGSDPAEVTGRGTGINDETHARKIDVVRRALELHQPDPADPVGVLSAIGGLEHAALVGLVLGGASLRTPVILDGVSAGAAALVARAIAPEALAACIAGHRSAEPGHVAALNKLGLRPLIDLDLRLGEGTGALLALPVVQSAARAMHEVATFDSAGVTEKG
ncbi:nicotinate-nucleotide--dimethylbenzimidazole phosphoribosyltransferase [Streptomyces sp. H27-D2]|uniref:nicotinate-nucleotide--dimethylbenzimidazole phosphoribosyltransferase n=1 Tax=Streptomyces sp. H27-D2 TaxID=3046304 RepID=UPI002DBD48F8|nr:nicotinate-nucleotide--dimethylbenzimidazole phosphoribosyltransferase [Streptomyces sp. H27-D2]MEC4017079.1 nicotinate-nucleotide--dimethylbenzimidazole phosphoribosyltransferase [Streptomyces sp. H27-D2]